MKQLYKIFFLVTLFVFPLKGASHHYKGLPHFNYFENYPQVPHLEFIKETPDFEIYVTVYNFQGLNLDQVDSPNDVRLYLYIYDIKADKVFMRPASFQIFSHNKLIHKTEPAPPEQENIFVIQKPILEQDDLILRASFEDRSGKNIEIDIPFQITETFFQKYGIYLAIAFFFALVISIKLILNLTQKSKSLDRELRVAKQS
jgi:hypothetical protein